MIIHWAIRRCDDLMTGSPADTGGLESTQTKPLSETTAQPGGKADAALPDVSANSSPSKAGIGYECRSRGLFLEPLFPSCRGGYRPSNAGQYLVSIHRSTHLVRRDGPRIPAKNENCSSSNSAPNYPDAYLFNICYQTFAQRAFAI